MNCEKCQDLLSEFLDGGLAIEDHTAIGVHLDKCVSCSVVHQELDSIVTFCRDHRGEYEAPPNERALWLRIRNSVEGEQPRARAATATGTRGTLWGFGWATALMRRHWELTLPQMAAAVVAVALVVSFVTALGVRTIQNQSDISDSQNGARRYSATTYASNQGTLEDRLKRQQEKIDYWNQRVAERKALWNSQTREAFERNLKVIDQSVADYREELRRNPADDLSEEMLNAALNDKMDLLREFSDL